MTLPRSRCETVIVGSDPILGVLVAIPWRIFRPRAKIVHWCHDLYPAAAVADGLVRDKSIFVRFLRWVLGFAYRRCDAIVDLGSCMRQRLIEESNNCKAIRETVTPWSLVEPDSLPLADNLVRRDLFGDAQIGLLYSGNLGRAHLYEPFVALANRLNRSGSNVSFCFSGRGPKVDQIKNDAGNLPNIQFAGFAPESELEKRLSAADIHMVSLHPNWTGTVVPSKFFGALAAGRPVLFAGSNQSAIGRWITEFDIGWVLNESNVDEVQAALIALAHNQSELDQLKKNCFEVYQLHFSRDVQMKRWEDLTNKLSIGDHSGAKQIG